MHSGLLISAWHAMTNTIYSPLKQTTRCNVTHLFIFFPFFYQNTPFDLPAVELHFWPACYSMMWFGLWPYMWLHSYRISSKLFSLVTCSRKSYTIHKIHESRTWYLTPYIHQKTARTYGVEFCCFSNFELTSPYKWKSNKGTRFRRRIQLHIHCCPSCIVANMMWNAVHTELLRFLLCVLYVCPIGIPFHSFVYNPYVQWAIR